jgi:hypothetical protein
MEFLLDVAYDSIDEFVAEFRIGIFEGISSHRTH